MHFNTCYLFVYDNAVKVSSRFMPRGVRQAWACVGYCGAVFFCLWWGLRVTPVCCCGCADILTCLRYGWKLRVYKYNKSVDNTMLYFYTKIVYFVRATCFELVRSSSGHPRRQIQELFMFHCIVGSHNAMKHRQLLDLSSWVA